MESIEKCSKGHTDKIIFRVRPEMKSFVKEFAGKMNLDVSDFMRLVLEYYWMAFFVKSGSYEQIREKFFSLYPDKEGEKDGIPKRKRKAK